MISLDLIKQHCRIDVDDDDDLLKVYRDSAVQHCEGFMGRLLYADEVPGDDSTGVVLDSTIRTAILLLISHWYDERSATTVPQAVYRLLQPYRVMGL